MRRFFIFIFSGVLLCIGLVFAIGAALPKEHRITIKASFNQPVAAVWDTVANFENAPKWNPHLKKVTRMPDQNGHEIWQEEYDGHIFYFETLEKVSEKSLVRKILNKDLPYSGAWTFTLVENSGKTDLLITEDGFVDSAFARFIDKFVLGQGSAIAGFMLAFGKKFQQDLKIEIVANDV